MGFIEETGKSFEEYVAMWDAVCSDWEVRWLNDHDDYIGDDVDYRDISLSDLLSELDADGRLEYSQAEICPIQCISFDEPILRWDGNVWERN